MIADFYKIPIDNVKNLVPNFIDKGKYVFHYEIFKKVHCVLDSINHNG